VANPVRARVVQDEDVHEVEFEDRSGAVRVLIDPSAGAHHVMQFVARIHPRSRSPFEPKTEEEALYVVAGHGLLHAADAEHELEPGTAAFVPPATGGWLINNGHQEPLRLVAVVSPPIGTQSRASSPRARPAAILHERDQPPEPAGDDREFRLLIDPRHGARHLTQFVGFIDRSKAPLHTHTYEEAIYILEGAGVVHVAGDQPFDAPIRPGTSIFLPPGTPHCLENASPGVLKLLGVFSPPGSPAMKRE
jgi:quercetin dioxygenase-like cupin family protein